MSKLLRWLGICFMLMGCAPSPTVTPTPPATRQLVRLQYTPAIRPWTPAFANCAARDPSIGLVVQEVTAPTIDLSQAELTIRLGLPDPAPKFSAPIGEEQIVVIVHPSNRITQLARRQLEDIYSGRVSRWTDINALSGSSATSAGENAIQIWTMLSGDDLGLAFTSTFLGDEFASRQAYQAPSPEAMLQSIGKNPGAIGFTTRSRLDETVREVPVEGMDLDTTTQPVLMLANQEPGGAVRKLAVCLQEGNQS